MAFSNGLGKNGTPPTKLDTKVTVTFDKTDAGWKIASSAIEVRGDVPGIDQATFADLAEKAKDGCPVSGALKGNVELSVQATLASG
jgi:osmotically inducible protein OsmC